MISYTRLTVFVLFMASVASGQECPSLTTAKKSALVEYVRKEYGLKHDIDLQLIQDNAFKLTCYRELTFQGRSLLKTWKITLYLSPDGRFLTGELFDTTIDPVEEKEQKAQALMADLIENRGTSKGPEHAPVTIVEFSDFECPYCRHFAELMEQVLPEEGTVVRVVFHHMPLSTHSWARLAAEGAACAQLQNSDAFCRFTTNSSNISRRSPRAM